MKAARMFEKGMEPNLWVDLVAHGGGNLGRVRLGQATPRHVEKVACANASKQAGQVGGRVDALKLWIDTISVSKAFCTSDEMRAHQTLRFAR
jgi:hypothetical protein